MPASCLPMWLIIFITSLFSAGFVFRARPIRLGLWKWFWVCLCEVPRGFTGSHLIFMFNFYGRLCFQRMLKQYLPSSKLFCNVILPLSHQEVAFISPPDSRHPFSWALTNRMWQKWHRVTSKTALKRFPAFTFTTWNASSWRPAILLQAWPP